MSVEFWAEFFQAAGLEPEVAASYANIFFVNKIQPTHLPDIDRDALKEMNITPMGDIFTILKHIKISCSVVTTPTTISGNEQPLFYQGDVLKSPVKFRNVQDSKNEYFGQNQFECGVQHTIAKSEKSFLPRLSPSGCQTLPLPSSTATHYLRSAELPAGYNLPPTTIVHESPLDLTVRGNLCSKKNIVNDCETSHSLLRNSVNETVSCDTSETASHMCSTSPDEFEMSRNIDALKHNPDTSMNISDVESCEWQQPLSVSPPVVPSTVLQCNKCMITNHAPTTKEILPHSSLLQRSKQDCSQNVVPEMIYTKSTMNQRFCKEKITIPGGGTSHQKLSVFDRLGQRSNAEEVWVDTGFQQFQQNQKYRKKLRQKCIRQRDNGVRRRNHSRKKWQHWSVDDNQLNNNLELTNTAAMGSEPLPKKNLCVQSKIYNEDTNKELNSTSHLDTDKIGPRCNMNCQKQLEAVTNGNFSDAGTSNVDRNDICQVHSSQELHSDQEHPHSSVSTIQFTKPQDGKTLGSTRDNVKLCQEALKRGPDAVFMSHTAPCISSKLPNEDPELESLRDPNATLHTEQFYLAWADRRKCAQLFPGLKPSFLKMP